MEAALGDHGCGMSRFFHNLIATAAAGVPVKQTVLLVSGVIVVLFF